MSAGVIYPVPEAASSLRFQPRLAAIGIQISRYGLVVVLLLIGALKFTAGEAAGIQPLVAHSRTGC